MHWKNELDTIEQSNNWQAAVRLATSKQWEHPEVYYRVIFLLLAFVVEGQYTQEEHDTAAQKLKLLFDKSAQHYAGKPEFLFFTGFMIYMGEWYFGMDSVAPATAMLNKAMHMAPTNTLHKRGYYASVDQNPTQHYKQKLELSEQLLFKEQNRLTWLKSKGLLGKYIIRLLEGSYETLKSVNTPEK